MLPSKHILRTAGFFVLVCALACLAGCAKQPAPAEPLVVHAAPPAPATETPSTERVENARHAKVISEFGPRKSGKRTRMHKGVDIKAAKGCAVLAWDSGEIIVAEKRRGYGLCVDVRHENGIVTRYAHMSKLAVKKGERVLPGDALGAIGRTGRATTDHLHFEVLKNGKAINPIPYIEDLAQLISPDPLSRKVTAEKTAAPQKKTTR